MKITVTEDLGIQLEEVFSGLTLKTESGETMSICMRDSGFEFNYQGEWYSAQKGKIEKFPTKIISCPSCRSSVRQSNLCPDGWHAEYFKSELTQAPHHFND